MARSRASRRFPIPHTMAQKRFGRNKIVSCDGIFSYLPSLQRVLTSPAYDPGPDHAGDGRGARGWAMARAIAAGALSEPHRATCDRLDIDWMGKHAGDLRGDGR